MRGKMTAIPGLPCYRGRAAALFCLAVWWITAPAFAADQQYTFSKDVLPFLTHYCVDCHSGDSAEAGFAVDRFTEDTAPTAGQAWRKIYEMVDTGTMPPEDPKPTRAEIDALLGWIEQAAQAECKNGYDPGRVTVRRLNRIEYNNTIRDLLGVDASPADDFPADDVGYGFDNIGDVLTISPIHTEKYLAAAEKLAQLAIYAPETRTQQFEASRLEGGVDSGRARALASTGEVFCTVDVPRDGQYVLTCQAYGQQAGRDPVRMEVRVDDKVLETVDVPAQREKPGMYRVPAKLTQGKHRYAVKFINDYYNLNAEDPKDRGDRNMFVISLGVRGPVDVPDGQRPASHDRLIFCHPEEGKLSPSQCAEKILERFTTRAYRRPVTKEELQRLVTLASIVWQDGESFERGVQLAVQAVLSSPHFLLRVERDASGESGPARRIDEYSLATRLSYFLWSTMPDEELFDLAQRGELRKNLQQQVRRMLQDPKSKELVHNFANQWLHTRILLEATPDKETFPQFNEDLRQAMKTETEMYFEAVMREDRSILDFISSDFTFLNEQLAKHYGIDGVTGNEFRKVTLQGDSRIERGGILTHASILTVTSNPNRTSPVKRGKWILEQILGAPPPPPPPDVEPLNEEKAAVESASLRERFEIHRAKPECATCHALMDPLGFALENYDAVGAWREQDGKFPVDASATLPDGRSFDGPAEMKMLLRNKPQKFVHSLAEKMLTYAIGRGLDYTDHCAVDEIAESLTKNGYRFSSLILAVVNSDPFQLRGTEGSEE